MQNAYSLPKDMITDNRGAHWPTFVKERKRCEVCNSKKIELRPLLNATYFYVTMKKEIHDLLKYYLLEHHD